LAGCTACRQSTKRTNIIHDIDEVVKRAKTDANIEVSNEVIRAAEQLKAAARKSINQNKLRKQQQELDPNGFGNSFFAELQPDELVSHLGAMERGKLSGSTGADNLLSFYRKPSAAAGGERALPPTSDARPESSSPIALAKKKLRLDPDGNGDAFFADLDQTELKDHLTAMEHGKLTGSAGLQRPYFINILDQYAKKNWKMKARRQDMTWPERCAVIWCYFHLFDSNASNCAKQLNVTRDTLAKWVSLSKPVFVNQWFDRVSQMDWTQCQKDMSPDMVRAINRVLTPDKNAKVDPALLEPYSVYKTKEMLTKYAAVCA
jgi:hypothetical protein